MTGASDWRIFLGTLPCGSVSCNKRIVFNFPLKNNSSQVAIEIMLNPSLAVKMASFSNETSLFPHGSPVSLGSKATSVSYNHKTPSYSITFTDKSSLILKTWLGVEITILGLVPTVRVPALYRTKCQGLCGQFDGILQNEYQTREGVILDYTPSEGYTRSDNEWEMAKSWIWDGGSPGLNPNDVKCNDEEVVEEKCRDLLNSKKLLPCRKNVEFDQFFNACKALVPQLIFIIPSLKDLISQTYQMPAFLSNQENVKNLEKQY